MILQVFSTLMILQSGETSHLHFCLIEAGNLLKCFLGPASYSATGQGNISLSPGSFSHNHLTPSSQGADPTLAASGISQCCFANQVPWPSFPHHLWLNCSRDTAASSFAFVLEAFKVFDLPGCKW